MMTIQVLAVLLCMLLLWTLVRDRKVMTLKARIIEGFILFGFFTGGAGSLALLWGAAHLTFSGTGALLFGIGIVTTLATLAFEDRFVIRPCEFCGIYH